MNCRSAAISASPRKVRLFALPEVTLGYIPSAGGTQTLSRTIPPGRSGHMILSGEPITARDALRWGLVDEVVAPEALAGAVDAAVGRLLAAPHAAKTRPA